MLTHYLTLGLSPSASHEEIRRRYLALIRRHPPSREPERSQRIVAAYEALKDDRSRVETILSAWPGTAGTSSWRSRRWCRHVLAGVRPPA